MIKNIIKTLIWMILGLTVAIPTGNSSELSLEERLTKLINNFNFPIPKQDAKKIATAIVKLSHKHEGVYQKCEVPAEVLLTIAMKESTLNRFAYNKRTKDVGLMQINEKIIKKLNLNKAKLATNIHYNMSVGCYLLSDNKTKYSKKRPYWVGIYNAGTAFWNPRVVANAKKYDKDIKIRIKDIKLKYKQLIEAKYLIAKN